MRIFIATLMGLSLAGCSNKPVVSTATAQSPAPLSSELSSEPLKKLADKETQDLKAPLKAVSIEKPGAVQAKTEVHESSHKTEHQKSKHHSDHSERGPVPAEKALGWLKNGNTRFTKRFLRNDGDATKDRTRLASGQKPHTIILSCSDSRVPPEIVFDQKLGEVFVIRTAGEALDSAAIASIEYALAHLGSNLIVVMGHESCGAVKAALATLGGADAGSPWLNKLVADLHPHLRSFAGKPVSEGTLVEVWANTEGVAKDLVMRSQIVRDAINTGDVKIQTALYHLGSGVVEFK